MFHRLTTMLLGLFLGMIGLFVAGAVTWGFYSSGSARFWAIAFNWPVLVTGYFLPSKTPTALFMLVFLTLHFLFYIGIAWLLRRGFRKLMRLDT